MSIAEPSPPSTETKRSLPSRQQMPDEIWGLWNHDHFVAAIDEVGDPKLMFFSAEDARQSAEYHRTAIGLEDVRPVLIYRKQQVW